MTSGAEHGAEQQSVPCTRAAVEEQVRRKGLRPLRSLADLRADVWESDEELHDFLDHLYASRHADTV